MFHKNSFPIQIVSPRKLMPILLTVCGLVSSCGTASPSSPTLDSSGPPPTPENTPVGPIGYDSIEYYSSEQFGFCYAYPQGYTQLPYNETVEIVAPHVGSGDEVGMFWLEISDSPDRTAVEVAEEELSYVPGLNTGRWTVMLGSDQAQVLDGMPGQNLVRRVYTVHQGRLYILTFSPTRLANSVAGDQMEALYETITNSWTWAPCSDGE